MMHAADAGDTPTVLFIDDEPALRKLVQRAFSDRPFRLEVASDGEDGLKKIAEIKPDLIITDIMMPGLDGIGLVKAVKANSETRSIPIIFLTSKGDPRTMVDSINTGVRFYLTKPFTLADLLSKVEQALGIGN